MHEVLTTREAAEYLRTSIHTINRLAREGRLPAARLGSEWRFHKPALDRWLAGEQQYEEFVDQGLVAMVKERMADPEQEWVPWEQVKEESEALP